MPQAKMLLITLAWVATFFAGPANSLHNIVEKIIDYILRDPLSTVAIVLGLFGIWRAEILFTKLDNNLERLIVNMRDRMLDEGITVLASYAAFTRALQQVDLAPNELPKDAAFALLTTFQLQISRYPKAPPEQLAKLRKDTRNNLDKEALGYTEMLVKNGLATWKHH